MRSTHGRAAIRPREGRRSAFIALSSMPAEVLVPDPVTAVSAMRPRVSPRKSGVRQLRICRDLRQLARLLKSVLNDEEQHFVSVESVLHRLVRLALALDDQLELANLS